LSSRGEFGFELGGIRADRNALDPAIAACAHYLGADSDAIETAVIEYQEFKDDRHRLSLEAARAETVKIARQTALQLSDDSPDQRWQLRSSSSPSSTRCWSTG
jgi:FMN-dependent NADH-azoreductase